MEQTYKCLKEILEDQIKLISKKGEKITPEEVLSLKNALSSIEKINKIMREDEYGEGYSRGYYHEGPNRSPVTGRYISNGPMHGNMRMHYGDNYDHMYGHSIKDRMIAKLETMYDEAKSEHERQMVSNAINHIQSDN